MEVDKRGGEKVKKRGKKREGGGSRREAGWLFALRALVLSYSSLLSKREWCTIFFPFIREQVSLVLLGVLFFPVQKEEEKNVSLFPLSSLKPEEHLRDLLPAVEPRDLEGREALAVPRGEGAVARGELVFFVDVFFLSFESEFSSSFSAKKKKKK